MNTQNILKFFGSKLDIKLDSSEYYDYELSKTEDDYNGDVLDFNTPIIYSGFTIDSDCLSTSLNIIKPWNIEINVPYTGDTCDFTVRKRTEKGWTLDFVFNRENKDWSDGKTFYYWGIVNESIERNFGDNNLSFSFTNDGKIRWESYRYSGYCDSGYTETYYISSGETSNLCSGGTLNDFNITIVFERYNEYYDCDLKNEGGENDYITGWTVTNSLNVISGATEEYSGKTETLNQLWFSEKNKRLGILKIYLNGVPIYKIKDWEEVIPSIRSSNNGIYQIWGGGTTGYTDIHEGDTEFNLKKVQYYEEPLDFVHVRHHYYSEIKPNFNITECNYNECVENVLGFTSNGLLTEDVEYLITEDNNNFLLY